MYNVLQRFKLIPDFGWEFMYPTKVHGNSDRLQRMLLHYQLYLTAGFQMEIGVFPLRKAADALFEGLGKKPCKYNRDFLFKSNFMALFKTKWSTK